MYTRIEFWRRPDGSKDPWYNLLSPERFAYKVSLSLVSSSFWY